MDNKITIEECKCKIAQFRNERGWAKFHTPRNLAISINLEAAELLELFQWKEGITVEEVKQDNTLFLNVTEEISDIFSNLLGMCNLLEISLSDSFFRKLEKNKEKYPIEKCYGKSDKYIIYK